MTDRSMAVKEQRFLYNVYTIQVKRKHENEDDIIISGKLRWAEVGNAKKMARILSSDYGHLCLLIAAISILRQVPFVLQSSIHCWGTARITDCRYPLPCLFDRSVGRLGQEQSTLHPGSSSWGRLTGLFLIA